MEGFMMCVMAKRKRCVVLNTRAEDDAQRQLLERRQVAAAQVLTRAVRQWCQRQRDRQRLRKQLNLERDARLKQYEITAVTVQRWWRVIQPQKAYWRRRTTEVEHERRQRAEAERIARAATTIQKRVRGVQARARVDELKRARAAEARALRLKRDAAVTVLTIVLQEHVLRQARIAREAAEQQVRQEGAVQRIAEGWKSTLARRRMDVALQRARQLRTSATCIQRVWKRYFAGRQRRYLRQIRRTVEEERLARELHLYTSVVLVQCAVRGAQDELLVRRLRARVGRTFMESLFLVQAVLRAGQARQALGQARLVEHARRRAEAAALEQRRLHAVCLVQAMVRAHRSAYAAQKRRQHQLEEKLHVHSTAAREMREDAAATVVQRAFRRHQQRQRTAAADAEAAAALQYLHKVARCIQQAWRAYAARQERRLRAAAVERCSRKRQEQEEVMELIWRDQKKELDMLYTLEFHYIAEAEHAARIALYQKWTHPSDWASATQSEEQWNRRSDDEVARWAEIYVD
ncbi:hypothetical protein ABL78_6401 [Leptomonas seymouri]|uniref:Uncharacterized protein n=1 Tax=Leptomonas seymouri TaxID=5684 RepID=A0A0N0P3U4_LEPSE|nr:hypothetical protein ABL78_6401 [Leptomonas seymouri]|eukprot:KPI84539.1 hypothetical protein ABL78_6401 [Leptomonas seymouri]